MNNQPSRGVVCLIILGLGVLFSAVSIARFGIVSGAFHVIILPAGPFVVLAFLGLAPSISVNVTIGAAVACVLTMIGPYFFIWSLTDQEAGANIGAGLMILGLPIVLPFTMALGGLVGWKLGAKS